MEEYKTVTEIAIEWKMTDRGVRELCRSGKIPGVTKLGNVWAIPSSSIRPKDGRQKNGKFINWRKRV